MKDPIVIIPQVSCALAASKDIVIPPTKAGQIPVAELQASTGKYIYAPKTNPTNDLTQSDIGKALKVESVDQDGVTLSSTNAVLLDEALTKFFNQPGLLTAPSVSIVSANSIHIGPIQPIFTLNGKPHLFSFAGQTVVDTLALSNNPNNDVSYIEIDINGFYGITSTPPSPLQSSQYSMYLFQVLHPNGTAIKSIRPIYTEYGYNATKLREIGESIGTTPNNFIFAYVSASGTISQTSTNANIRGYSINTISSDNKDQVNFPSATLITCEYFSFNSADSVASFTDFRKLYKIDNPLTGVSTTLPANQNGIITILGSLTGKYLVLAPQKAYTSSALADSSRLEYLASLRLPAEFKSFYTILATAVVSGNAATGIIGDIKLVSAVGLGGGSLVAPVQLPDPSTGTNGQVVVVNTATSSYILKDDNVPDLSNAINGQALFVQNGKIVPSALPATINNPTGYFPNIKTYTVKLTNGAPSQETGDVGFINVKNIGAGTSTIIYFNKLVAPKMSIIGARLIYNAPDPQTGTLYRETFGGYATGSYTNPTIYFATPGRFNILNTTAQLIVTFIIVG